MRRGVVAAVAVLVGLTLGGCGSQAARSTYTPTVTVATPDGTPDVTAPATPVGTPTPLPTVDTSSGSTPPDRTAAPCRQRDLRIDVLGADSGAGSVGHEIVFTNGGGTCRIAGTPRVFVADAGGSQIGRAAEALGGEEPAALLLPGGTARAVLTAVNIGDDGGPLGDACAVEQGAGWAVTTPGATRSRTVPATVAACTQPDTVFLRVGPVVVDAGSAG